MNKYTLFAFFFLSILFGFFQNNFELIYNPGDSNFSANPNLDYFRSGSVIDWKQSFGIEESLSIAKNFPYNFFLVATSQLNLSIPIIQSVLFSILLFIGFAGFYLLIPISNNFIRIILSVLYIFNPYSITLVLGGSNFMPLFMVIGLPYLIYSYFKLYEENFKTGIIYLLIGLLITKASLTNPMYGLPFILFIISSLIICRNLNNIKIVILITFVTLVCYADLISGLFINLSASKNALIDSTIDLNILYFVPGGSSIFNTLSLLPHWGFFGSYSEERYYTYSKIFEEIRYTDVVGVLTLLFLLFIILKKNKDYKLKIYLVLFFISLFFTVGSNFPTGKIYNWLVNITGLSYPLRESHDKATAALALSTIILISYYFSCEKLKKLRIFAYLKLLTLCFFVFVALLSGNFFRDQGIILGGTRYKLHDNYKNLADIIEKNKFLRVLVLPPQWISVPGIQSMLVGKNYFYTGPDPLDRITHTQFIFPSRFNYNNNNNFQNQIFFDLMSNDKKIQIDLLRSNGINAVLYRKDYTSITYRYNNSYDEYLYLLKNSQFEKIFEDDIFLLYKLNE